MPMSTELVRVEVGRKFGQPPSEVCLSPFFELDKDRHSGEGGGYRERTPNSA